MKKLIKAFVLAVAFLGLTEAKAAKIVKVTINQEFSMVNISLIGVNAGESLVIKKFKGETIYRKVFNQMMNFEKKISFKEVENGVYFVEVENNNKLEITPVLKNNHGVILIEKAVKVFAKPQFKIENGEIGFSLLNPEANEVDITVSTEAFVIRTEKGVSDLEINRTFNTTKLKSGSYSIVVKIGTKSFAKEFNIQ